MNKLGPHESSRVGPFKNHNRVHSIQVSLSPFASGKYGVLLHAVRVEYSVEMKHRIMKLCFERSSTQSELREKKAIAPRDEG